MTDVILKSLQVKKADCFFFSLFSVTKAREGSKPRDLTVLCWWVLLLTYGQCEAEQAPRFLSD